jgi:hypothetical protein
MATDVFFSVTTFTTQGTGVSCDDGVWGGGFNDEGSVEDCREDASAGDPGETRGDVETECRVDVFG